jgi:glycosyltransferase involved in cell wall biosynthesis
MLSPVNTYRFAEQSTENQDGPCSHRDISVIIPAYNAAAFIGHCLESVLVQSRFPARQIIVVDDGSSDSTVDIVRNYAPDVTLCRNDTNRGMSATWNVGIDRADGEILIFIDQDCVASHDWLAKLVNPFQSSSDHQVVQGNFYLQYFHTQISSYHAAWRRTVYLEKHTLCIKSGKIYLNTINTRNVAIYKSVLMDIKRRYGSVFNEQNSNGGGDLELGRRLQQLGTNILFEKGAKVYHMDPVNLQDILKQKYRHAFFAAQAGFTEKVFDLRNFQRVVTKPTKYGVPIWFSLLIWFVSMYGFQNGLYQNHHQN